MKTLLQIVVIIICLIPLCPSLSPADETGIPPEPHIQDGDRYFRNNQYFMAVNEYEQAVQNGVYDPDIFRKLSFLYYHLGFPDKSVREIEKAVSLSPHSELLRMELGIAYLAINTLDKAKEQFMAVITKNPGFANGYYYLGEIFYRKKDYDMAWMLEKRARCLGHMGRDLLMKLSALSKDPGKDPCVYSGEDLYIRQILVDTKSRAEEIVMRIEAGELFEDVAAEADTNRHLNEGGYLGKLAPSELHPGIIRALTESKAFSPPVTVETESGFHIVQRIAPFDISYWKTLLSDSARHNKKQTKGIENTIRQTSVSLDNPKGNGEGLSSPPYDKGGRGSSSDAIVLASLNSAPSNKKESYIVYAGSYRNEEYAIEDTDKLLNLGYKSYRYEETTESKGTFYIVVAGKYESLEMAKEAGDDIARQGFNYFIRKTN